MNRSRQKGVALLLLMLTLTVGAAGLFLSGRAPMSQASTQSSLQTQVDLERAAEAVIAYNLADENNPGALLCPDSDNSGSGGTTEADGLSDPSCIPKNDDWFVGRLPWRTLNLSREYGRLWYVIDGDYHDDHSYEEANSGSATPLNPGVAGSLSLDGESGYAAIIVDPGAARGGQSRQSSNYYDVIHYLENMEGSNPDGGNAAEDTSASNPEFIDCSGIDHCNDRARGITVDELFAPVQLRVVGHLDHLLTEHYAGPGESPRPASLGSESMECDPNTSSDDVSLIGHVPTAQGDCKPDEYIDLDDLDNSETSDVVEGAWIAENDWLDYIVYVVDKGCTDGGSGCGSLRVNGVDGVSRLLFGAGRPLPSQEPRPDDSDELDKYLDLVENTNGGPDFLNAPLTHENNDVVRWQ